MSTNTNVVPFPGAMKERPQVMLSEYDGESALVKIQHEHLVNALAMYLQTLPFALPDGVEVIDVDLGVEIDNEGYVAMDVYFGV